MKHGKASLLLNVLVSALVDIQNYTFTNYGENQLQKHEAVLDKALKGILFFTNSGHSRPDIPVIYQVVQAGEHMIIYRVEEMKIYVIRVLHASMNFDKSLSTCS